MEDIRYYLAQRSIDIDFLVHMTYSSCEHRKRCIDWTTSSMTARTCSANQGPRIAFIVDRLSTNGSMYCTMINNHGLTHGYKMYTLCEEQNSTVMEIPPIGACRQIVSSITVQSPSTHFSGLTQVTFDQRNLGNMPPYNY